jgi:hypothetical protein
MTYEPNDYQVAGNHYQTKDKYQLWDLITDINLNFLLANAIKYIYRCKNKNGIQDLQKAKHYIDKFFSLSKEKQLSLIPNKFNSHIFGDFLDKETQLSTNQYNLIFFICDGFNHVSDLNHAQRYINTSFYHLNEELNNATHN